MLASARLGDAQHWMSRFVFSSADASLAFKSFRDRLSRSRPPAAVAESQTPLTRYVRAFAVMMGGAMLGFMLTAVALSVGHGFGATRIGPWVAYPKTGGMTIDPYARAVLARSGEAPLGRDEGLAFQASVDSSGARLDGRCDYLVAGAVPAARFWSISLASPSGYLLPNRAGRYGYASSEILRREGGGVEFTVAPGARGGNWLSPGDARRFVILIRLYDAAMDTQERRADDAMPRIEKLACP